MTQPEVAPAAGHAPVSRPAGLGAWLVLATILPGMFMNVFDVKRFS